MIQDSCPAYQTASRVQRSWSVGGLKSMFFGSVYGVPALGGYLSPPLGAGYAPVAQHDDGHVVGNCRGRFLEQFHGEVHLGAAPGGAMDALGHGDGATAVEDTDEDDGGLVVLGSGTRRLPTSQQRCLFNGVFLTVPSFNSANRPVSLHRLGRKWLHLSWRNYRREVFHGTTGDLPSQPPGRDFPSDDRGRIRPSGREYHGSRVAVGNHPVAGNGD